GTKALDQHVALLCQPFCDGNAVLMLHVEAQAALAAVIDGRQGGVVAIGGTEKARPVALGRLDLDDFGAVDAKQHRGIGRGDALPEIEHAQAAIRRLMRRREFPAHPSSLPRPTIRAPSSAAGCCRWLSARRWRMCRRSGPCR